MQGDTLKYLTDGYTVTKGMYADCVLQAKKETRITLKFSTPRAVRGILIYNSYRYENAFASVSLIQFELSQRPEWYTGGGDGADCFIRNLGFSKAYKTDEEIIYSGVPAVATFNEIMVNSITVTVKEHLGGDQILNIAEIAVLGK